MSDHKIKSYADFQKLINAVSDTLEEDVDRYLNEVSKSDDQFWRRGFVRAVFAYIEGTIFTMKFEALVIHKIKQATFLPEKLNLSKDYSMEDISKAFANAWVEMQKGAGFSPYDLLYLLEISVELDDKGQVRASPKAKITLEKNIVFAFRVFAQANDVNYRLDKSTIGWQEFKKAIKIRDRLMHPKRITDLTISPEELEQVMRTQMWFYTNKNQVFKLIIEKHKKDNPIQD